MTVDDIRRLSPEQMNRIAEIRSEIEELECEAEQILAGEKPRRAKPKAKKKSPRKPAKRAAVSAVEEVETAKPVPAPDSAPEPQKEPQMANPAEFASGQVEGVLTRLALPKPGVSVGAAGLDA